MCFFVFFGIRKRLFFFVFFLLEWFYILSLLCDTVLFIHNDSTLFAYKWYWYFKEFFFLPPKHANFLWLELNVPLEKNDITWLFFIVNRPLKNISGILKKKGTQNRQSEVTCLGVNKRKGSEFVCLITTTQTFQRVVANGLDMAFT